MSRSEKPVTFLLCSPKIPHLLRWEALGAMMKNNVTSETVWSQWGDYED